MKIADFDQTNRPILEEGINLLRYGFTNEEISEFFNAVRQDSELADFINKNMDVWGPGLGYEVDDASPEEAAEILSAIDALSEDDLEISTTRKFTVD